VGLAPASLLTQVPMHREVPLLWSIQFVAPPSLFRSLQVLFLRLGLPPFNSFPKNRLERTEPFSFFSPHIPPGLIFASLWVFALAVLFSESHLRFFLFSLFPSSRWELKGPLRSFSLLMNLLSPYCDPPFELFNPHFFLI